MDDASGHRVETILAGLRAIQSDQAQHAKAELAALTKAYQEEMTKRLVTALDQVHEHTGKEILAVGDELVGEINKKLSELRQQNERLQAQGSRPALRNALLAVAAVVLVVAAGSFAGGYYLQRAQAVRQVQDSAIAQMKALADDLCPADRRAKATDKN